MCQGLFNNFYELDPVVHKATKIETNLEEFFALSERNQMVDRGLVTVCFSSKDDDSGEGVEPLVKREKFLFYLCPIRYLVIPLDFTFEIVTRENPDFGPGQTNSIRSFRPAISY